MEAAASSESEVVDDWDAYFSDDSNRMKF
jgi:hypothetical protein